MGPSHLGGFDAEEMAVAPMALLVRQLSVPPRNRWSYVEERAACCYSTARCSAGEADLELINDRDRFI
jgi:hypothetical protein